MTFSETFRLGFSTLMLRLTVGGIFVSEGIQKFLFSDDLGSGRFAKLGFPNPGEVAGLVGASEILLGAMLLFGIRVREACAPLLLIMAVAIWTTKLSALSSVGFWKTAHEARTDLLMIAGLLALLASGSGPCALSSLFKKRVE